MSDFSRPTVAKSGGRWAVIAPFVRGSTLLGLVLWAASGCRSREGTATRGDASPIVTSHHRDAGAAASPARGGPSPIDALGTIYPPGAPAHPLAIRLCEALHGLAARRKAECCGGDPAPFLVTECARVLGATLRAGTVELEEAAIDRCASAMGDALAGCDWVTPGPSPAPEACQQLLRGKLERGGVCRSSLECAGAQHCAGLSPTKTGVCAPPAGDGAGCGAHVDVLATYLADRHLATTHPFCAHHCSLVAHQCGPLPQVGSACLAHVSCAPSQRCIAGRCSDAPRGGRGEPCGAAPCADGLRCIDAVCAPLGRGEACTSDLDCAVGACVREDDGRSRCGPQCSASLDALRVRDGGLTLGLPTKARAGAARR